MASQAVAEGSTMFRVLRERGIMQRLKAAQARERGLTRAHRLVLEDVYEVTPRPDAADEARLAAQLGVEVPAVTKWYRLRRVRDKRDRERMILMGFLIVLILGVVAVLMWRYSGIKAIKELGRKYWKRLGIQKRVKRSFSKTPLKHKMPV